MGYLLGPDRVLRTQSPSLFPISGIGDSLNNLTKPHLLVVLLGVSHYPLLGSGTNLPVLLLRWELPCQGVTPYFLHFPHLSDPGLLHSPLLLLVQSTQSNIPFPFASFSAGSMNMGHP